MIWMVGHLESRVIRFHGFANLTTTRGVDVRSPVFSCFGHQWELSIYPGGVENSREGFTAIQLANMSNTGMNVSYGFSVRNSAGKEKVYWKSETFEFGAVTGSAGNARCAHSFAKRSTLMESLVNGSLAIEVRLKSTSTDNTITQFIPSNPIYKNVLKLFMNEETADVIFE